MILLKRSLVAGIQGPNPPVEAVLKTLQSAIELEHATIPLYLYALYSLDAAKNAAIAGILQSVVIEEMLHMTLASNVMNALGGSPDIDKPDFIPNYPGPLPGGVQSSLTINLAPFSMDQLETFLTIEQPEDPLVFKAALLAADGITIGQFYTEILTAIGKLGPDAFVKPPRNQVGPDLMQESVVVTDFTTAQQAITTIIDQGEGTKKSPLAIVGKGYAHYYRYMQIKKGKLLIPDSSQSGGYAYAGAAVPFDAGGVYPVPTNPAIGQPASRLTLNFNYTYTSLLGVLHGLFNGQNNHDQFNHAFELMMSLKEQAKAMMSGLPNSAVYTGPTFEYQPTNPAFS
jgi:ferritin-like protein